MPAWRLCIHDYINIGEVTVAAATERVAQFRKCFSDTTKRLNAQGVEVMWIPVRPYEGQNTRLEYVPLTNVSHSIGSKISLTEMG